jgi:sugar/nucleoside kinase (ribokinase family)
VATLGAEGCCYSHAAGEGQIAALVVDAVDPIGCGDSFAAAMLQQLIERETNLDTLTRDQLQFIMRFATAASALTATRHGVIPALPLRSEVDRLLQERTAKRGA